MRKKNKHQERNKHYHKEIIVWIWIVLGRLVKQCFFVLMSGTYLPIIVSHKQVLSSDFNWHLVPNVTLQVWCLKKDFLNFTTVSKRLQTPQKMVEHLHTGNRRLWKNEGRDISSHPLLQICLFPSLMMEILKQKWSN